MTNQLQIPAAYTPDIERAIAILKSAGCTHIYLFGSLASGKVRQGSDIDLAIKGCPKGKFFNVYGKLMRELNYRVDLISLDSRDPFGQYLEKSGRLVQLV